MTLRPEIEAAVERNEAFAEPAREASREALEARRARRARRWLRVGDYTAAALVGLFFGAFNAWLGLLVFLFGVWLIHRADRPGLPPPWMQETPEEALKRKTEENDYYNSEDWETATGGEPFSLSLENPWRTIWNDD